MRARTIVLFFVVGMGVMFFVLRSHGGAQYAAQNADSPGAVSGIEHGLAIAWHAFVRMSLAFGAWQHRVYPKLAPWVWPVVFVAGVVFTLPGSFVAERFWYDGMKMEPYGTPYWLPTVIFGWAFSWVFWRYWFPLGLDVVGLYNPFRQPWFGGRSWFLRLYVRLREWWEIRFSFGQQASGGWADRLEVLSNRYRDGDVYLGRPSLMKRPIGLDTDRHIVTIATPGSGKSTAALAVNLAIHTGSVLCIDPKGELAAITAARRGKIKGKGVRGMGQRVYVLDPFHLPMLKDSGFPGAYYNVFDELAAVARRNPDEPVRYAGRIADAMVQYTPGPNDYFDKAAHSFLRGLILYVFTHEPLERRNLVRLRELVTIGDRQEREEQVKSGVFPENSRVTAFDVLVREMLYCEGARYDEEIKKAAAAIQIMGDKQMGSVISTAQEHTSFLDSPELQRISTRSDFLLEHLKNGWTSIYVCLPMNALTGKEGRWLRMFVLMTFDMMESILKPPDPPILMAIDEFPNLGFLEGVEKSAATCRSRGLRLWLVGQNLGQFQAVYEKNWKGLVGDAGAMQYMGVGDPTTIDYLMEQLGKHVVIKRRRVQGGYQEYEERPVHDRAELGRILSREHKTQIICRSEKRPMKLKITPYFQYMPWWQYDKDIRFPEKFKRAFWRAIFR